MTKSRFCLIAIAGSIALAAASLAGCNTLGGGGGSPGGGGIVASSVFSPRNNFIVEAGVSAALAGIQEAAASKIVHGASAASVGRDVGVAQQALGALRQAADSHDVIAAIPQILAVVVAIEQASAPAKVPGASASTAAAPSTLTDVFAGLALLEQLAMDYGGWRAVLANNDPAQMSANLAKIRTENDAAFGQTQAMLADAAAA